MKYGIVYGYWNKDWEGPCEDSIIRAAKNGFDYLEVFAQRLTTLPKAELDSIKRTCEEQGMELCYLVGLGKEHDVASLDEQTRLNGVALLKKMLDTIHYLGGTKLSGINFAGWMSFEYCTRKEECRKASLKSMKEVGEYAAKLGIDINLEITNRFEQFLLNTSAEAVAYVEELGLPNVKVLLDSFHMMLEEDNSEEAIKHCGKHLGHFHVGENNRKNPGGGMMRWDLVANGLKAIGYDGYITLEPLVLTGGTVSTGSNIWRDMSGGASEEKLDQDAIDGLNFIKKLLA